MGMAGTLIASFISAACFGDGPTAPPRGAVGTFRFVDETFKVQLIDNGRSMPLKWRRTAGGQAFRTAASSPAPA
jgi:hypothetical protein